MKAVILAAGQGTRLNKGWTIVPKPLIEVADKTIIEHVISNLKEVGIKEFVIVIGFMSEHIKDYLRNGFDQGVQIEYVYNPNYKENMVSSLIKVKELVEDPFIVCMADLFFKGSIIKSLLGNVTIDTNYAFIDKKLKTARRIEERVKIKLAGDNINNISLELQDYDAIDCGIYLLQKSFFVKAEECITNGENTLPQIIAKIASHGQFQTLDIGEHQIIDIDREKDVEYVQNEVYNNGAR